MSLFSDFVTFVDGGSRVKYFVDGGKYVPKPLNIIDFFEFDFKQYYKTSSDCFIGISCQKFVRKIRVKDFNDMKSLYLESLNKVEKTKERAYPTLF